MERGMHQQRSGYREQTWAPLWALVITWAGSGAAIIGLAYGLMAADLSRPGIGAMAGIAVAIVGLLTVNACFLRLDVEVRDDHVFIAFGPINLIRKRIHFSDMGTVRGLTYSPLREFGGWGIRPGRRRTAWTIRGNQAVAITLRSDRQIYVGSQYPQRLAGAIRTAMRQMPVQQ